jgi:hypothetical protein
MLIVFFGLSLSVVCLVYFVQMYLRDYYFSVRRLVFVVLVSALVFNMVLLPLGHGILSGQQMIGWPHIVVFSCMMGVLCGIFSLGLGCAERRGMLGRFCAAAIRCQRKN